MKGNTHTNRKFALLTVFGLVIILLFSPCAVRNSIQSLLDVQQTDVTSKSKSTLTKSSCSTFETLQVSKNTSKVINILPSDAGIITSIFEELYFNSADEPSTMKMHWSKSTPIIPYYILYQNFKVYLL